MVSQHPSTPGPTWVVPTAMGGFLVLGVWQNDTASKQLYMTSKETTMFDDILGSAFTLSEDVDNIDLGHCFTGENTCSCL